MPTTSIYSKIDLLKTIIKVIICEILKLFFDLQIIIDEKKDVIIANLESYFYMHK